MPHCCDMREPGTSPLTSCVTSKAADVAGRAAHVQQPSFPLSTAISAPVYSWHHPAWLGGMLSASILSPGIMEVSLAPPSQWHNLLSLFSLFLHGLLVVFSQAGASLFPQHMLSKRL